MEQHSQPIIEIEHLSYSVRGDFWSRPRPVLRDVSLTVMRGEVFGFLGPNGAGKTTTLKALLGLLRPQAGHVRIAGLPAHTAAAQRLVGFMPERAYFPAHMSARELVVQHGKLAGLPNAAARARSEEVLKLAGLADRADRRLGTYSKGMLQRVGLAQALVGDPDIVVLDEPTSGLDPLGRRDMREVILHLHQAGKTVVFCTHILPDAELLCQRVAILVDGQVRRTGLLQELANGAAGGIAVDAEGVDAAAAEALRPLSRGSRPFGSACSFEVAGVAEANQLIDALRGHGAKIRTVQTLRSPLEDLFVRATGAEAS